MKRILSVLLLVLMLASMLSSCGLQVPRPEIKTGEFNFSVTYEFNGEITTLSGVYVCEYNGTYWSLDGGYHRDWKGYIKDGTTEEIIKLATADDGGIVELNLHFDPKHFMGDSYWAEDDPFSPWMSIRLEDEEGLTFENDADIIAETYGARIISFEYDEPIKNTFKALI